MNKSGVKRKMGIRLQGRLVRGFLSLCMKEYIVYIYIMERHGTGWECSRKVSSRDPWIEVAWIANSSPRSVHAWWLRTGAKRRMSDKKSLERRGTQGKCQASHEMVTWDHMTTRSYFGHNLGVNEKELLGSHKSGTHISCKGGTPTRWPKRSSCTTVWHKTCCWASQATEMSRTVKDNVRLGADFWTSLFQKPLYDRKLGLEIMFKSGAWYTAGCMNKIVLLSNLVLISLGISSTTKGGTCTMISLRHNFS